MHEVKWMVVIIKGYFIISDYLRRLYMKMTQGLFISDFGCNLISDVGCSSR